MLGWGAVLLLLIGTYLLGNYMGRVKDAELERREEKIAKLEVTNLRHPPQGIVVEESFLCTGECVGSVDYFRSFVGSLINLIGGEMTSFQTILARTRREAVIRMLEQAHWRGATHVINVRVETSRIGMQQGKNKGLTAVEVFAYGTAVRAR